LTKWLGGPNEITSHAAFGPRVVVWRPLLSSIDAKQAHFRSHAYIDNEFFSAKHDCATGSQSA